MGDRPLNILIIDDDEDDFILIRDLLEAVPGESFTVAWESVFENALEEVVAGKYDVCLVDYRLGGESGLELIAEARQRGTHTPLIFLTGQGDLSVEVEAMKVGASDYLVKGQIDSAVLGRSIRYAVERYRSQQAIQESERNYRDLVETSSDLIWKLDSEANFSYVNSGWEKLLGYTPDEMLGHPVSEFKTSEQAEADRSKFERLFSTGEEITNHETTLITKQGRVLSLIVNARALIDATGNVCGTQGAAQDITERKRHNDTIQKLVEGGSSVAGVAYFEEMACQMAQLLEADYTLIGELNLSDEPSVTTLSMTVDGQIVNNLTYELKGTPCAGVMTGQICSYTSGVAGMFPEDEMLGDMSITAYVGIPLSGIGDTPIGLMVAMFREDLQDPAFAENIMRIFARRTASEIERIKAERALRESEERFRELSDLLPQTVFELDAVGNISYCNQYAFKSSGYTQDDIDAGLNVTQLFVQRDRAAVIHNFKSMMEGNPAPGHEHTIVTKDGKEIPVLAYLSLIVVDDSPVGIRGILVDITELKQAQEQKQLMAEKLKHAERMQSIGVLAGGVAHDLNNLLGPVIAYPDLILEDLPDDSPARPQIKIIEQAARQAIDVIQDLLALARRGRYEMKPLDFNSVIETYLDSANFTELKKTNPDIVCNLVLCPQIEPISGSASHLGKVIMNLVVNAFEVMQDGGEVTLETSQRNMTSPIDGFSEIEPGDYVIFKVKDTGKGIASSDLDRIFEPYFSKKEMGQSGSGLGLSVVYGIVQDHGGYCQVLSEADKGTEFILYFPAVGDTIPPPKKVQRSFGGTERILIVDDDTDQRNLAIHLLSSLGYHVAAVSCGRLAIEHLEDHPVDLVVLDMIMEEGFDGLDTYKRIIEHKPGQKVIIVSGYAATERVRLMHQLGAGAYVRKPYTRDIIGLAVRQELERVDSQVTS